MGTVAAKADSESAVALDEVVAPFIRRSGERTAPDQAHSAAYRELAERFLGVLAHEHGS